MLVLWSTSLAIIDGLGKRPDIWGGFLMVGKMAVAPKFLGDGRVIFEERRVPSPNEGELLLAVGANAICGTDRPQYFEGSGVTPGHEAAGVVVETGPGTA